MPALKRHLSLSLLLIFLVSTGAYIGKRVDHTHFGLAVATGKYTDKRAVHVAGFNPDVDATPSEDIWDGDSALYIFPDSAETHYIFSSDTTDDTTGTGAISITIYGIGSDSLYTSESLILSGTDTLETATKYLAVFRMIVTESGDSMKNNGTVMAVTKYGGTVSAQINPGNSQTFMAVYMTGKNERLALDYIKADIVRSATSAGGALITVLVNTRGSNTWRKIRITEANDKHDTRIYYETKTVIPPGTKILIRANSDSANNGVMAEFGGVIEEI